MKPERNRIPRGSYVGRDSESGALIIPIAYGSGPSTDLKVNVDVCPVRIFPPGKMPHEAESAPCGERVEYLIVQGEGALGVCPAHMRMAVQQLGVRNVWKVERTEAPRA